MRTRAPRTRTARPAFARSTAVLPRAVAMGAAALSLVLVAGSVSAAVPAETVALGAGPASATAPASTAGAAVSSTSAAIAKTASAAKKFDKKARSLKKANSYWVVVNKQRRLNPKAYVPKDLVSVPVPYVYAPKLRKNASKAVVAMFKAYTRATNKKMQSQSAYRSYTTQVSVYQGWVDRLGQKGADKTSARPGYSEHQTGLAIDISARPAKCSLKQCFEDTSQGKWLKKNAWKYGFIMRYPKGKTSVTGYEYEPWHYRFVGKPLAREMHKTGTKTMEEFFGLKKAPNY